ncbi:MAG: ACT domain-containing protein [Bryobacteraceae bacterium]
MISQSLTLSLLEGRFAVCRLAPGQEVPAWAAGGTFTSVTRTRDELSVVCSEGVVPAGTKCEGGWRLFQIEGPLDFGLIGIMASVTEPLANAGVSIFALSTFDTDYVMVKDESVEKAIAALAAAGHRVRRYPM